MCNTEYRRERSGLKYLADRIRFITLARQSFLLSATLLQPGVCLCQVVGEVCSTYHISRPLTTMPPSTAVSVISVISEIRHYLLRHST